MELGFDFNPFCRLIFNVTTILSLHYMFCSLLQQFSAPVIHFHLLSIVSTTKSEVAWGCHFNAQQPLPPGSSVSYTQSWN